VRRVAVTGTASFLGGRLLRRLAERHGPDAVVALDVAAPPRTPAPVRHHEVDLTRPGADQEMLDVFRAEGVGSVVHTALSTNPRRDSAAAHELESIGTLALLAAAAAAGVTHVVLRSFTAVYGARGDNPNFLDEERELRPNPELGWARDKLEVERHAAAFARRYPAMTVTVLRFAPLFGPGVRNFYTALFERRVVPVLMGYDPLLQLLHPEDALGAFEAALARAPRGPVNVVPRSAIPLLAAVHLADRLPLPIPHPLAYAAAEALWAVGAGAAPAAFLDYIRYLCVADGEKAEREMGFKPRFRSRDSLDAHLAVRHRREQARA
jgi:UDP-glucose 4-epimerase